MSRQPYYAAPTAMCVGRDPDAHHPPRQQTREGHQMTVEPLTDPTRPDPRLAGEAHRASCVGRDPEWWYAPTSAPEHRLAVRLCHSCPAAQDCLQGAVERDEPAGIWGGHAFPQPALLIADTTPAAPSWCGTAAGFKAHGCRCPNCTGAHARDVAVWRRDRNPTATTDPTGAATSGGMVAADDPQQALFPIGA